MHPKKADNVSRLDAEARYGYFVRKTADFEIVWGLAGPAGWVTAGGGAAPDAGEAILIPFWPEQAFAACCAQGAWTGSVPQAIALQDFMQRWLPGMQRDARLCLIFPTVQNRGLLVLPERLAQDLAAEIVQYE